MQTSIYSHPAAPARVIPLGEEPMVTRAKVLAQLRTAIAELETGDFGAESIGRATRHLQNIQRVLFVAKVLARNPGLPARLRVGLMGREVRG